MRITLYSQPQAWEMKVAVSHKASSWWSTRKWSTEVVVGVLQELRPLLSQGGNVEAIPLCCVFRCMEQMTGDTEDIWERRVILWVRAVPCPSLPEI